MNRRVVIFTTLIITSLLILTSCQGQANLEGIIEGDGFESDLNLDTDIFSGEGKENNRGTLGRVNSFVDNNWQIMFLIALLLLLIIAVKK
jgi:hypothetical protein